MSELDRPLSPAAVDPRGLGPYVPHLGNAALLLARIGVGVVFAAHGWQKLFGQGLGATAAGFEKLGVPLPAASALYASVVELVGGIALIVGLAVPVAGVLLALDMLGAFLLVHAGNGIFVTKGGFELVAALGLASLLLAVFGSGRFGLDELIARRWRSRSPVSAR